jgi:2-polyprenyl-6-methoxyphenol hydroxylase-like FAD-dependent oxidoreductase
VQELEPDIDPVTIGDAPVAFFPEEGWLDPVVYAHAMLSAAQRRHGAKVICGARVIDLMMAGDRVTGVRVADGAQYEADFVVNCAGRWTNEAARDAGLHLPLAPTVGFLVFTPPVAASLSRVVRTTVIDARPDGAGRLMLHWNPTDASLTFDTRLSPGRASRRSATPNACPRATRQRSWEERCRKSTSGSGTVSRFRQSVWSGSPLRSARCAQRPHSAHRGGASAPRAREGIKSRDGGSSDRRLPINRRPLEHLGVSWLVGGTIPSAPQAG